MTSETTNMAHFIDTETFEITDNVLVGSRPRFAEFTADGSRLWVTSEVAGTVAVIDAKTRKIIKTIGFAVPGVQPEHIQPVGVRITKDGTKAFVALGPANRVAVIDAKTLRGGETICSSASGCGSLPSRPMRSCCSRPTATATMCR